MSAPRITVPASTARPARAALLFVLATLAFAFTACGDSDENGDGGDGANGGTATPRAIPHPTDPHTLILGLDVGGGLPPPRPLLFDYTDGRSLLLYGDGRLLRRAGEGWQELRLTPDGIQRLLRMAVEDASFFDQPDRFDSDQCFDCLTTVVQLRASGREKTIRVYALGMAEPTGSFDRDLYDRIAALVTRLHTIEAATFGNGEVTSSGAYQPRGIWLQSVQYASPDAEPVLWPSDVAPLTGLADGKAVCGAEAKAVLAAFGETNWLSATQAGSTYAVAHRTLYPDDQGAGDCGLERDRSSARTPAALQRRGYNDAACSMVINTCFVIWTCPRWRAVCSRACTSTSPTSMTSASRPSR